MANSTPPEQRDAQKGRTLTSVLVFVGGIALYFLFGLLLWWALDWYIAPKNSTDKKNLVQALALIMAGVAGAIGIYFTWRGQRLTQKGQEENQKNTQEQLRNAQEQLKNAQEELRLNRAGQITERFTRAIDQLGATNSDGSKSLEIR